MQNRFDFIVSLIKEAGQKVLESRDKHLEVSSKNGDARDLVTNVDLEVNQFITESINAEFPNELIYSEETKDKVNEGGSFWSVDPIDGTSNFARSLPHYAVVISWMENGEPIMGAIYNPVTKELFSFEKSRGSFLNGSPIKVSTISTLKEAYILLHIGRKEDIREWGINLQKAFLAGAKKNINLGSSALDLAFLAAGRVDVVIYGTMTTMDIACATALVRASGGDVYSIDGTPVEFLTTPQQIIATSNKALFEEISKI
jgi:myo-inositol-1(or 4)-monophosphatase